MSAWVRAEEPAAGKIMSMHTIVANKYSGCETDEEHGGFALFINEWNTNSEQLYASWGNKRSGCAALGDRPSRRCHEPLPSAAPRRGGAWAA